VGLPSFVEYVVQTTTSKTNASSDPSASCSPEVCVALRPIVRRRQGAKWRKWNGRGDGNGDGDGDGDGDESASSSPSSIVAAVAAMVVAIRHYFVAVPHRIFVDLFLPLGYPQSVGPSYLSYQIYDSVQGICSYLRGVVSTSAILTAAGVGDAEATAMSAAAAWALRDGLGMMGGLLFSYFASKDFDSRVKEWRLFADVVNDIGLFLDMIAPRFAVGGVGGRGVARAVGAGPLLFVTSLATVCKSMCGISAGATKASITHHFAARGNMADLSAKEGTQETLVSLLGMILGVALARYLHRLDSSDKDVAMTVSWTVFAALTVVHVWANYKAVKLLRLRTLNRQRAEEALGGVVEGCTHRCLASLAFYPVAVRDGDGDGVGVDGVGKEGNGEKRRKPTDIPRLLSSIPTPCEVDESLWSSTRKLLFPGRIRLGTRLTEAFQGLEREEDVRRCLEEQFRAERYVLTIASGGAQHRRNRRKNAKKSNGWRVCVALRYGANEHVELKAFVHALLVCRCISRIGGIVPGSDASLRRRLVSVTHACVKELFGEVGDAALSIADKQRSFGLSLAALSDRGWECERLYLGFGPWRIQWEEVKLD